MQASATPFPGALRSLVIASVIAAIAACGGGGSSSGRNGGLAPADYSPEAGTGAAQVKSVAAISQTRDNTLVVDDDGVLWARGSNIGGALGIGTGKSDVLNLSKEAATAGGTASTHRFVRISSSETHSLALTGDGVLWGWGDNGSGQLGDIGQLMAATPMQLATDVVAIAAAGGHSLYVTRNGDLYAMGANPAGQLGTGDKADRTTATLIGTGFTKIATGWRFSVALKDDGSLWTWGSGTRGELGNGSSGSSAVQLTPQQIGSDMQDVFAGSERAFAIRNSGELIGWGDNFTGSLGLGTKGDFRATPEPVASGYASVHAGAGHTLGVKADGSIAAWGNNMSNQLTLGKGTAEALTPTPIAGRYDFVSVGGGNTLLASRGGQLKAYGASFDRPNNDDGNIDFPYDPNAGLENTTPSDGTSGNGGQDAPSGGGSQDALAYAQVDYSYSCEPVGGIISSGTIQVSNGPCINEQKAYAKAMACNEVDADYSFNAVGRPFYQCLVDNSSGSYQDTYRQYLDAYSK